MSENKTKKESKVRTSITISPEVLSQVRAHCDSGAVSVSSYVEEAVVAYLAASPVPAPVVAFNTAQTVLVFPEE